MKTFSVKNFAKFQHYKDRSPPWIKLYNELLDDYEFGLLPDATKMHLIAIWLLASRSDNKIPFDKTWVARRINANDEVNLPLLAERGFIVVDQALQVLGQDASTTLAECLSREETQVQDIEQTEQIAAAKAPAAPKAEKVSKRKPKVSIAEGFTFSDGVKAYAKSLGFKDGEIAWQQTRFVRYAKENDRKYADWDMAGENWFDKALEFAGKSPPAPAQPAVDDGFIEVTDEEALAAWDAYAMKKSGKSWPRNSRGGWRFPSKWPPGYVKPEPVEYALPPPQMRTMQ